MEDEATGADRLIHEVFAVAGNAEKVYSRVPIYQTIMDHPSSL